MKRRVLMIEDDPESCYLQSYLLRRHGFEVITAHEGKSGLRLGQHMRPDVVLVDVELPGMDGVELLKRMRKDESMKDRVMIVVSASCELETRARAFEAGADAFICKPIAVETFADDVSEFIERKRE